MNQKEQLKVALIAISLFIGMVFVITMPFYIAFHTYPRGLFVSVTIALLLTTLIFPIDRFTNIYRAIDLYYSTGMSERF